MKKEMQHRRLLNMVEDALESCGLVGNPIGPGDYFLYEDFYGEVIVRVAILFRRLDRRVIDALHGVVTSSLLKNAEIEVAFFDKDESTRLPTFTISSSSEIRDEDLECYFLKHSGMLNLS